MPVSSKNPGTAIAITRWGLYSRRTMRRNAPDWCCRSSSAARTMSLSSTSTFAASPRMRRSEARASSSFPRRTRLLGVSGMNAAPTRMTAAGVMATPSDSRHPHTGMVLAR
uniref:Uncharacterized protein n=1 Tax=Oryza brachyantha TaxID=4533 RepID=J3LE29_ORYBR